MNDESLRLTALAHLKNGKKPTEVAEITGLTYAKALKLKKQLYEAEETDALNKLFSLNDAALEMLLESVKKGLKPAAEEFYEPEVLEGEIEELSGSIRGLKKLDTEMQTAAIAIANRIEQVALTSNNADTLVSLSDALSKLQISFFGVGSQGNPMLKDIPGQYTGTFEKFLKD